MKKLILAAFALTTAASVFAQGTVWFANRIAGTSANQSTHIWGPSATAPTLSLIGLGSNDNPAGAAAFGAASSMALIGVTNGAGHFGVSTTFAQLIGAVGSNVAESSLVPVGQTTTFKTGTALGGVFAFIDTLTAAYNNAPYATFEIVAWDNFSGLYSTWAQASTAWRAGTIAAGGSGAFTVGPIGGDAPTLPPYLNALTPLNSFNLYYIPEPSTFALAGLGTAALLIFRRRK